MVSHIEKPFWLKGNWGKGMKIILVFVWITRHVNTNNGTRSRQNIYIYPQIEPTLLAWVQIHHEIHLREEEKKGNPTWVTI